jgi:hypothetical protein
MEPEVALKFRKATQGLRLDKEAKKELMDWYADDHETIKNVEQACFTLLVKQHCLRQGYITIRKFDEEA